jgi:hypothetical protein
MDDKTVESPDVGPSRVRASAPDQFAGLRGRDYIAARNLKAKFDFLAGRSDSISDECVALRFSFLKIKGGHK